MINPGGNSSVVHAKSAVTRMNNNLVNAARASMPLNAAAQASLRHQSSSANPSGPPVGNHSQGDPLQGLQPMAPVELPTGGPQMAPDPEFDPEVFKQNVIDNVVGQVRTQQFLNSPQVKDAVTTTRLKNVFNSGNPRRSPDSRNLFEQVMSRMGV